MYLWRTRVLAQQIAAAAMPPNEKLHQYIASAVLYTFIGYMGYFTPQGSSWLLLYEAAVVLALTFAGAGRVAKSWGAPVNGSFFEASVLLSVPLLIKTTVLSWLAYFAAWWLIYLIGTRAMGIWPDFDHPLDFGLRRLWESVPFVVVVVAVAVFWWRLSDHVAYVASRRAVA
jgi:hypothetical protein